MKELTVEDVKEQLKDIIADDLDANIDRSEIDGESSLYDDGIGLDSIAIINFIVLIEKKFVISFEEGEISGRLFGNINTLAAFIYDKKAPAEAGR
jgi:acyl carrier protein